MILERFAYSPLGTFGKLKGPNFECFTVERPWAGNMSYVSCIPEGHYRCKRVNSPKFGNTFEVTGVNGRTHILFHKANRPTDLEGCIGLGDKLGALSGDWAVLESAIAFKRFLSLTDGLNDFDLFVTQYHPEYP